MPVRLAHPKGWGPPVRRPSSEPKKVALLGGSHTLVHAPWDDPTWKLWAHASCRHQCQRRPDLLFDLHPKALWSDPVKKHWDTHYVGWLGQNAVPIYMQQRYPEAPASLEYPFERVMAEFGQHPYFTNQVAWMIALALTEGVTHIGIYGCDYATGTEYERQRGSAEFWCGVAIGRGVQLCLPPKSPLLKEPRLLYGYESHPDGVRDKSYAPSAKEKPKVETKPGKPAIDLKVLEPGETPTLRPVLGPDGRPSGERPARERWAEAPAPRIYTATSVHGGPPVAASVHTSWVTWQGIRGLADCELWDGALTGPMRGPVSEARTVCYTRQPWLVPKASAVLAQFRGVLVTSFCDPYVTQAIADASLKKLGVRHWFAVQVNAQHAKLTAMPLGIDRRDVADMEAAPRVPWADRDTLLYTNLKAHTAERRALVAQLAGQDWATTSGRVAMPAYFAALGRSKFVLSPPGLAWDCYRTYEALAMGAVPIVKRQRPISDVVEGLPVLVVDDWREVTQARLEAYEPPTFWNLERLTLAYWAQRIKEQSWQ